MIHLPGFTPLPIPVPPMLETTLGYPGRFHRPTDPPAHYCGFYWSQGGDEAAFDDGQRSSVGMMNNNAFLAFVQHRRVAPHLRAYNYGSSETEAEFYLVLDREARTFYAAPVAAARQLLVQQWGPPQQAQPLRVANQEELKRMLQAALDTSGWTETTTTGSTAHVLQAMREEQAAVQDLVTWLDSAN
jgi:hypothetical protein